MNSSEITIKDFIEENIYGQEFNGCSYCFIDDLYAIVFAWDNEGYLCAKLAYNCDDLRCDYDFDWCMPNYKNDEVLDTELIDCTSLSVDAIYDFFMDMYKETLRLDEMEELEYGAEKST